MNHHSAAPGPIQAMAPDAPPFDMSGDPTQVPEYKQDTDWANAISGQLRLIRGFGGKLRALGVIALRMLP